PHGQRQQSYQKPVVRRLLNCDLEGAEVAGMDEIGAAMSPDHAANLQRARQIDAVLGLVGAPLVVLLLVGFVLFEWLRYGRDPVYLDDPSIYMPAPPPDLTPASAALVVDGRSSR